MVLPAFADLEAFAARLPGGISATDEDRAQAALDDASALIRAVAGKTWVDDGLLEDDIPDVVAMICMAAARRAFVNPESVQSEKIDDYSVEYGTASLDIYLTANERRLISQAAGGAGTGLWTLGTTRCDTDLAGDLIELDGTAYLPVVGSEPIPFLPVGE